MKTKPTYDELEQELEYFKKRDNSQILLDLADVIFISLDTDGIVTNVNKKTCEIFGYEENEMIGKNWVENFLPERIKNEILQISKRLLSGEIETLEYNDNFILTKDGNERLINWHNKAIEDKKGQIIGYLSSGEDITEKTLKESLCANTLDSLSESMHLLNSEFEIIYINDAFKSLVNSSGNSDEIVGKKIQEVFSFLPKEVFEEYKQVFTNAKELITHEANIINGKEFYTITKKTPVKENGKVNRIITTVRDITQRRKIELKLIESEENYRNLFNENPIALREEDCSEVKQILNNTKKKGINITKEYLDANPDFVAKCASASKVINVNKATLSLIGHKNANDYVHGKVNNVYNEKTIETIKNEILAFANNQKSFTEETEIVCDNGNVKSVIFQYNVINDYKKIIFSITDITKLKEAEKAIRISEEHLQEVNATKDKFFSIISHDLKNPFNSILGFTDLLSRDFEKYDDEKKKKYINIINNETQIAVNLLSNLLSWSRVQTGRIKCYPEKLDVNEVLSKEFETIYLKAEQKNIKMSVVKDDNYIIDADRNMISTIFRNLLSNAIKFTPKNGAIKVALSRQTEDKGNKNIKIIVSDTGLGISPQNIKRLFKIDENSSTTGIEGEKGTGLGLILCKEFVEIHGGEIWVESEEGKGSKFIFTIPVTGLI